jgi:sirohydrochlorin cobaltochelatase
MAGDGPRSWKTALGAAGIACEPVMRGAAECDEFLDIWLDHLRDCVAGLAGPDAPSPAPASTATWPA